MRLVDVNCLITTGGDEFGERLIKEKNEIGFHKTEKQRNMEVIRKSIPFVYHFIVAWISLMCSVNST